ncbi:MAG TPA: hypothetical protein VGJ60_26240 [Chloroflexota bacterium]|jgi:hypothetical protein
MGRPHKEFCWRGHPLADLNLRFRPNGARECWACRRITAWEHELDVADTKDRRVLTRLYANTYDLIGREPQALEGGDAAHLMQPTREWLADGSLLCWMAGQFMHPAEMLRDASGGLAKELDDELRQILEQCSGREGPPQTLVIDLTGMRALSKKHEAGRELNADEFAERYLGLENVNVLFLPVSGGDAEAGSLLLRPRHHNVCLHGVTVVDVHPDGSSSWWGPFIEPYGDSGWGSFWAAQRHNYAPNHFPVFVSFRTGDSDGPFQRQTT